MSFCLIYAFETDSELVQRGLGTELQRELHGRYRSCGEGTLSHNVSIGTLRSGLDKKS